MKKISIIIPCYNCAKTLERCLDSVFGQTYKNIEVIAVNDGSKDNTLEILKSYAEKYSNLRIIDKANNGVSSARNDAIRIATGEYVVFIDSDDNYLANDVLEKNVRLLEKNNVEMVIYNFIHPCFEPHLPSGIYDMQSETDFKRFYQDFFYFSMPWNKIIKREVITEFYDETMAFEEDEIFNLANIKNVNKIYINNEVLYNYYCAPVVKKEEASAINKLFVDDKFYEKKNTIWYLCAKNNKKIRDAILKKNFPQYMEDMEFVRSFDFFFYDFAFMCHLNIDLNTMKKQCVEGIVREKDFFDVLKSKEKYGLKLKSEDLSNLAEYMDKFVEMGNIAFHKIKSEKLDLKIYLVLFGIFAKCFYNKDKSLNTTDLLAEVWQNLENKETEEAKFTNNLVLGVL